MAYQLCTNNKRIFDFYTTHKSLDFEQINLLCIDLFENVLQDASATINKSIGSQILSECLENRATRPIRACPFDSANWQKAVRIPPNH